MPRQSQYIANANINNVNKSTPGLGKRLITGI
jgi:hypothetical protein